MGHELGPRGTWRVGRGHTVATEFWCRGVGVLCNVKWRGAARCGEGPASNGDGDLCGAEWTAVRMERQQEDVGLDV
jgi:hypothetical protein